MFSEARWVEDEEVASRAIYLCDNVVKICNHWEPLSKSKQLDCKSYLTVLEATKDPLIKARLHFFSYVSKVARPFVYIYQTTVPMMPFFNDDLHNVMNFNFLKKNNLKKKPDVGFGSRSEMNDVL